MPHFHFLAAPTIVPTPAVPPPVSTVVPLSSLGFTLALVALAGYVDAVGFVRYQTYVSFMSGNVTQLGVATAQQNAQKAGHLAVGLAVFVLGVVVARVLHNQAGRWGNPLMLLVISGLLLVAQVTSVSAVLVLTLAMGMLSGVVHQLGHVNIGVVAVTGAMINFGSALVDWFSGKVPVQDWLWQLWVLVALVVGALFGAVALSRLPQALLLLPAGLSLLLAVLSWQVRDTK